MCRMAAGSRAQGCPVRFLQGRVAMLRKVNVLEFVSLDGVTQAQGGTPFEVTVLSVTLNAAGIVPSANNRFPPPNVIGKIFSQQQRYSALVNYEVFEQREEYHLRTYFHNLK